MSESTGPELTFKEWHIRYRQTHPATAGNSELPVARYIDAQRRSKLAGADVGHRTMGRRGRRG